VEKVTVTVKYLMHIKICGLFRNEDINYVNEARPDYVGFVFAESKRQVSPVLAQHLRFRLADNIIPVGVFVNARIAEIVQMYQNGIISIAQLHGDEDDSYITALKKASGNKPIPVIKSIIINPNQIKEKSQSSGSKRTEGSSSWLKKIPASADYLLIDSGAGSGKPFNWKQLDPLKFPKPWFLAGGIDRNNAGKAITLKPFAIDVSSGVETDGIKNREKILSLVETVKGKN